MILHKTKSRRRFRDRGKVNICIKKNLSRSLRRWVKGEIKSTRASEYLSCNLAQFRQHIERMFSDQMNWQNHGSIWHLDHVTPCRSFDLSIEDEVYRCFHHTNFQPLLIKDNLIKGDRLPSGIYSKQLFNFNERRKRDQ